MEAVDGKRVIYEFDGFILDPNERTLTVNGQTVHLPAKEFETLLFLIEHNGRAVSKDEMMSALWPTSFVEETNLAKHISKLRKLLGGGDRGLIETIPKHGYRLRVTDLRAREPEPLEPVVVEKRTVRRVTIALGDTPTDSKAALLPAAQRPFRYLSYAAPILLLLSVLGLLAFYLLRENKEAIDPYAPVRLTDNPADDTGPNWTKDGQIRFTRMFSSKRIESWVMNADGSSQTAMPMPAGRRIFNWSLDEQMIIFQKLDDPTRSYLAHADGSGETVLPIRSGNWSPDSKMLVAHMRVEGSNFDIFVYKVKTGELINVTNSPNFDADPSFSPDGTKIVFSSGHDGNQEIYTINIDGSGLQRLTFNPGNDTHGAFSPDGTQILFTSIRDNETADVYLMSSDGSVVTKVVGWDNSNETAGPGGWSPDGSKIAFFSDRNGKDDIYLISAETARPRLLLSDPRDIGSLSFSPDGQSIVYSRLFDDRSGEIVVHELATQRLAVIQKTGIGSSHPRWSPKGNVIAFHDRVGGNSEVCIVEPNGSGFRNISNDPAQDVGPSWSPDGNRVVFISTRDKPSNIPRLFTMNADGSDVWPVTPKKGWEGDPVWMPDGRSIVFACDREDAPGHVLDICEIDADGTNERRILSNFEFDTEPAISPDGKKIAFTAQSDGNSEIYLVNADGSGFVRLTRNAADDRSPEWSPDGRSLLFVSNREGKFAIYEIRFDQ